MTVRISAAILIAGAVAFGAGEATPLQGPATGSRSIVVVSDMHMGVGRAPSGGWYPSEDFRWSSELAAFLKAVDRDGRGAIDLVLNGDTLELLQSAVADCDSRVADAGCAEPEALARVERVLSAHAAEIDALAQFARSGSNRVVFVPGDHDAALLFPSVARRLIGALGAAPAGRVEVATSGYWLSRDGKVYVEHGHQIGANPHKFERWPTPWITRAGIDYVGRPWGEQAVQPLYNQLEERYAIVDNFALAGAGLKYGLAADGMSDVGEAAPQLLRYFLSQMSWQQFRMELDGGETEPPTWDIAQARPQGAALLVSSLADDDRFKPLAAKAMADGRLARSMGELSDDELVALCDYRAASRRARRRGEPFLQQFSPRGPVVTECPRMPDTRGSVFDYFWRSRDQMFGRHLEAIARRLQTGTTPSVFVHGHTHVPDRGQESALALAAGHLTIPPQGFSPVRGALVPIVINGGAWQRTITPVQFERLAAERGLSDAALLRALQPEDLAPCYGFVQVAPYTAEPVPRVRYWRQAAAVGEWGIAAGCGR